MSLNKLEQDLTIAESLLVQGQAQEAVGMLSRAAEDAEEYVDRNYHTTDEVQYFSFPSLFDRLAYKRVERDPRTLIEVDEPFDRLYSDLAYALIQVGDYDQAAAALRQAIRWNPMNCGARLDLAELERISGNMDESLGLSFSVFARASEQQHLVRAYANFARFFEQNKQYEAALACLVCAQEFGTDDKALQEIAGELGSAGYSLDNMSVKEAKTVVEAEGLPDGANAEIAVCLLMCATDVAAANKKLATQFMIRARDLVGQNACQALLELILESDADTHNGGAHGKKA